MKLLLYLKHAWRLKLILHSCPKVECLWRLPLLRVHSHHWFLGLLLHIILSILSGGSGKWTYRWTIARGDLERNSIALPGVRMQKGHRWNHVANIYSIDPNCLVLRLVLILLQPLGVPPTIGVYLVHPSNPVMRPDVEPFQSAIRLLN